MYLLRNAIFCHRYYFRNTDINLGIYETFDFFYFH